MNKIDSIPFLNTILKFKKTIIIVGIAVAILVAAAIKILIKPKYESKSVVYAAQTYTESLIMPPLEFGYELHTEQFIQLMRSSIVRDSIFEKYNLVHHYKIEKEENIHWRDELNQTYLKNIWIDKTEYEAIEVTAIDINPDTAALIANDIVEFAANLKFGLFTEYVKKSLADRQREYKSKKKEVDLLEQELTKYSEKIDKRDRFNINNMRFERTRKEYLSEQGRLNDLKGKYETILNFLNTNKPSHYVISVAEPNYKKISPNTISLTLMITISVIFLLIVIITFREKLRTI